MFLVVVDSVDGRFEGNLPNHAVTARAIEEGDAEKARNAFAEADYQRVRELLGQWGQLMQDPSLDSNAGILFAPKHPSSKLVQAFNALTHTAEVSAFAVAYLFFLLRDTIGNQERDLDAKLLQSLLAAAKAMKLERELALAFYAIGLLEPNYRFMPALRTSALSASPAPPASIPPPADTQLFLAPEPTAPEPAKAPRARKPNASKPKAAPLQNPALKPATEPPLEDSSTPSPTEDAGTYSAGNTIHL